MILLKTLTVSHICCKIFHNYCTFTAFYCKYCGVGLRNQNASATITCRSNQITTRRITSFFNLGVFRLQESLLPYFLIWQRSALRRLEDFNSGKWSISANMEKKNLDLKFSHHRVYWISPTVPTDYSVDLCDHKNKQTKSRLRCFLRFPALPFAETWAYWKRWVAFPFHNTKSRERCFNGLVAP